jgi:hypothetical protein
MPYQQPRRPLVDASRFSMTPRADVPRSTFTTRHTLKTTFQSGYLIPIYCDEVIPGDVHRGQVTIFARLSTPIFPIMDQLYLETFFFFVPCRLVWTNWVKMMGQQANPADSISFTVPVVTSPANGFPINDGGSPATEYLYDYFGIPCAGQVTSGTTAVNALPLRAYNLIWNEWFRDENLQNSIPVTVADSGDSYADYICRRRNKTHDYFTSALPWPAKQNDIRLPGFTTGTSATVNGIAVKTGITVSAASGSYLNTGGTTPTGAGWPGQYTQASAGAATDWLAIRSQTTGSSVSPLINADLGSVANATVNALRLAVATQRLLEKDARGGTRYTELLRQHFGVFPEDARLQRPEYCGGGTSMIETSAIPQTSATGLTGGTTPIGSLGAAGTASGSHSFQYTATEHGYMIGIANVRAEITYQQGLHRMWTRSTRYDFYWPTFADLGEQIIRNDEIYLSSNLPNTDSAAFGYQERYSEYKYRPSKITGFFNSTHPSTIDQWHLSQKFAVLPTLGTTFIQDTPPLSRAIAAGTAANFQEILFDSVFNIKSTRPMPMFSVPGMSNRF